MKQEIKTSKDLAKLEGAFKHILNDIWCTYSFERGRRAFNNLIWAVEDPYRSNIYTEIGHIDLGHGINQARAAVKWEMNKYLDYLREKLDV